LAERILLTGASGFVGGAVGALLADKGYAVRAVSREPVRLDGAFVDRAEWPSSATLPSAWEGRLDGITHVVHCAGIANAGAAADLLDKVNVEATAALARAAAARCGGRFIHISSIRAVTGLSHDGVVGDDTPPAPRDAYGRSKLKAEEGIRSAFGGDERPVLLRPVAIYGQGGGGAVGALLKLASLPLPLPFGGIRQKRSLLDVRSLAEAVVAALRCPDLSGPHIVCDRTPVSLAELVTGLRAGLGMSPRLFLVPSPLMAGAARMAGLSTAWERLSGSLVADCSRLADFGWEPATDTLARVCAYAAATRSAAGPGHGSR
jgi:UDP-glucose 4-epimerase